MFDYLHNQELLLVLDNCEHLLEIATWLGQLLQRAPAVKLLLTSRARLNVQREWCITVEGLHFSAEDPLANEAVQLFLARANAVTTLPQTEQLLSCAAQICRLVSGLPLGIELAVAMLPYHDCAAIADGIAHNLDFLTTHYRDIPERHRTLRAAFEHSWRLLTVAEQRAFGRLTLFRGTFDSAAAQAVAISPHLLTTLVDKSLVRHDHGGRYVMHEMMHQFAAELLAVAPEEAADFAIRHSRYYINWLTTQTQRLKGRAQKEALAIVSVEFENIHAAWQTAINQQQIDLLAMAIEPLYYYCLLRSRLVEGLALFEAARAGIVANDHPTTQRITIHLNNVTAKLLLGVSRVTEARSLLAQNLADPVLATLPDLALATARYYGSALVSLGELDSADSHFAHSYELACTLGDPWAMANTLIDWARLAFVRKQFAVCESRCREGLAAAEQSGDLLLIANFLTGISITRREADDLPTAQRYIERSLAVYAELDDTYGLIQGHLTLGALFIRQSQFDAAQHLFDRALHDSQAIGFRWGEADAQWRLGQAALGLGDGATVAHSWRIAFEIALAIHEVELVRDLLADVAQAYQDGWAFSADLLHWLQHQPLLTVQQQATIAALLT